MTISPDSSPRLISVSSPLLRPTSTSRRCATPPATLNTAALTRNDAHASGTLRCLGSADAACLLAPVGVVAAVAGLALIATLGSSISEAIQVPAERIPAVATFLVAASGIAVGGISAAFWALVVGVVVRGALIAFPRRRA